MSQISGTEREKKKPAHDPDIIIATECIALSQVVVCKASLDLAKVNYQAGNERRRALTGYNIKKACPLTQGNNEHPE